MSKKGKDRKPLRDAIRELKSTLQALNKLAPGCTFVAIFLTATLIIVSLISIEIMMGVTLLVVLLVSVVVYSQTNNYGEAALALVAGLLTVYTVEWTNGRFITFVTLWVGLTLFTFLISSVKLAAEVEEIYSDAAISIGEKDNKKLQKQLEKIGKDKFVKMLGPTKRAEVIRQFAFRKLPVSSMQYGLRAVEMMTTITRVDHLTISEFVIDVYKMFRSTPGPLYQILLNRVYETIRESPVSPNEFVAAFKDSKRLALSGKIEPELYFRQLSSALDQGVAPGEIYKYLQNVGNVNGFDKDDDDDDDD